MTVWCQAIIIINADSLQNYTLKDKLEQNLNDKTVSFIQENAFENVICKMSAQANMLTLCNKLYQNTVENEITYLITTWGGVPC